VRTMSAFSSSAPREPLEEDPTTTLLSFP
jgi:hypothetical protein